MATRRIPTRVRSRGTAPSRERGVVLLIALIVLVAMTMAGVGMMRSIDTGTLVAGNIGFRQGALASTDGGAEAARVWLLNNQGLLTGDVATSGYYSSRQDSLDLTGNKTYGGSDGVDWGSDPNQPTKAFHVGKDTTGNDIYYVIHRLCSQPGNVNDPGQSCTTTAGSGIGSTQESPNYSIRGLPTKTQIYYRITVRANGPKNTVSYAQAVIVI